VDCCGARPLLIVPAPTHAIDAETITAAAKNRVIRIQIIMHLFAPGNCDLIAMKGIYFNVAASC